MAYRFDFRFSAVCGVVELIVFEDEVEIAATEWLFDAFGAWGLVGLCNGEGQQMLPLGLLAEAIWRLVHAEKPELETLDITTVVQLGETVRRVTGEVVVVDDDVEVIASKLLVAEKYFRSLRNQ